MGRFITVILYCSIMVLSCGGKDKNALTDAGSSTGFVPFDEEEFGDDDSGSYTCQNDFDCLPPDVCCDGICAPSCGSKTDDDNNDDVSTLDDDDNGNNDDDDSNQDCESDDNCKVGYYCDFGKCYEGSGKDCITDVECALGEECKAFRCRKIEGDMGGEGEPCYPGNRCDAGLICIEGICEDISGDDDDDDIEVVCVPGDVKCVGNAFSVCSADGVKWGEPTPCAANEICIGGECANTSCLPGEVRCSGNSVIACKSDGAGWEETQCEDGKVCKDGACAASACAPGEKRCKDKTSIEMCKSNGLAWETVYTCKNKDYCVDGNCTCIPQCDDKDCGWDSCYAECGTCNSPPANECADADTQRLYLSVGTCETNGKCKYEYVDKPCENGCDKGFCGECIPNCKNKLCGPDGCGGSCGMCGENQTCLDGACACRYEACGMICCAEGRKCVSQACCEPNCEGKVCGSDGCGGTCGTCPDNSTCQADGTCKCDFVGCAGVCCASGAICYNNACCAPNCSGKQCGSDGCGGSCGSCNSPPANYCDGNDLVSYPPVGDCAGSQCAYTPTRTTCTTGNGCLPGPPAVCDNCQPNCSGKVCGSDGCTGTCPPNTCNSPPPNTCVSGKKRVYNATGACNGSGTCDYGYTDTDCPYGCSGGECQSCAPNCSGKSCGSDGCTGSCGDCPAGQSCGESYTCVPAGLKETVWPMYHKNVKHTGTASANGAESPSQRWRFGVTTGLGAVVRTSVAIDSDNTIYFLSDKIGFLSSDICVYAVTSAGSEKWRTCTGSSILYYLYSTPAIGKDGTVYFGYFGGFKAFYANTGAEKWSISELGNVSSSPAIGSDGTIYVGATNNKLYAINPNGTVKWTYSTGNKIYSSPAIADDGTIYVGSNDDKLHAVNPNGTAKWSFNTSGDVYSSPTVGADGVIYIGSNSNKLFAVNPNGSKKWEFAGVDDITGPPALSPDGSVVYFGGGCANEQYDSQNDKYYCVEGAVYAVNTADGTQKWRYSTPDYTYSPPIVGANGVVYIGCDNNKLYALNPADGTKKWEFTGAGDIENAPAIDASGVIYFPSDKYLYTLNP